MRSLVLCVMTAGLLLGACSAPRHAAGLQASSLPDSLLRAPLRDTADEPLVIADELGSGRTVTLVFWQAWCGACRAEAPQLVAASRKYADMEIIGVVSGPDDAVDADELQSAIRELGLPYRTVRDRTLELTHALEVTGTPTIVVLGADGEILYRGHELPDWDALLQPDLTKPR